MLLSPLCFLDDNHRGGKVDLKSRRKKKQTIEEPQGEFCNNHLPDSVSTHGSSGMIQILQNLFRMLCFCFLLLSLA